MSALAVLDSHTLLAGLLEQARQRDTETLRAMYRQGTGPSARSPLWDDVLFALGVVLRERQDAAAGRGGPE